MIDSLASNESYRVYTTFLAMRRHFTEERFDYFQYNGKVRAKDWESFKTSPDVYVYTKMGKLPDYEGRILSSLIVKPSAWIMDILDNEDVYLNWKKRVDSLTYTFTNDLGVLEDNYFDNFKTVKGQHPPLITLCLRKKISFETFAILCKTSKVFDVWKEELNDKFVAGPLVMRAKKYEPFLNYDASKFKKIIRDKFF